MTQAGLVAPTEKRAQIRIQQVTGNLLANPDEENNRRELKEVQSPASGPRLRKISVC
jgi:hypothetical protein